MHRVSGPVHTDLGSVSVMKAFFFCGFVAVHWKMNDDFALFGCTVDVSDANVCHRVLICRWHACLDPPVLPNVRFCRI